MKKRILITVTAALLLAGIVYVMAGGLSSEKEYEGVLVENTIEWNCL